MAGGLSLDRVEKIVGRVAGSSIKAIGPSPVEVAELVTAAGSWDEAFPFKVKRFRPGRMFFKTAWDMENDESIAAVDDGCSGEVPEHFVELNAQEGGGQITATSTNAAGSGGYGSEAKRLPLVRLTTLYENALHLFEDRIEDGWVRRDRAEGDDYCWWSLTWPEHRGEPPKQVPLNPRPRPR